MSRRIWLVLFNKFIPKDKVDTSITDRLKGETDLILRSAWPLPEKARAHPDADLEAQGMMPRCAVHDEHETSIDPLTSYLNSGAFTFAPTYYMPLQVQVSTSSTAGATAAPSPGPRTIGRTSSRAWSSPCNAPRSSTTARRACATTSSA